MMIMLQSLRIRIKFSKEIFLNEIIYQIFKSWKQTLKAIKKDPCKGETFTFQLNVYSDK